MNISIIIFSGVTICFRGGDGLRETSGRDRVTLGKTKTKRKEVNE